MAKPKPIAQSAAETAGMSDTEILARNERESTAQLARPVDTGGPQELSTALTPRPIVPEPGTALVPVGDLSDTQARVTGTPLSLRRIEDSIGWIATSLDPRDEQAILDIWSAREEQSDKAKDWLNRPFKLRDWVQYIATKPDEQTGEEVTRVVTVLITDSGERFATWAPQVARSIGSLVVLGRRRDYPCGRHYVLKAHKSANNPGDWYCLTLVR
jgi:hypothetical protein